MIFAKSGAKVLLFSEMTKVLPKFLIIFAQKTPIQG